MKMKYLFQILIITCFMNFQIAQITSKSQTKLSNEINYSTSKSDKKENNAQEYSVKETAKGLEKFTRKKITIESANEENNVTEVLQNSVENSSTESLFNFTLTEENSAEYSPSYLSSSEIISTENGCKIEKHIINNVTIKTTQDTIEMLWKPKSRYAEQCKVKYNVNITSAKYDAREIPYFRQELSTHHVFSQLEPCTAYNVSLEAYDGGIFQKTVRTLPGTIENLNVIIGENITKISWLPSERDFCSNYRILLDDREITETNSSNIALKGNFYCTSIGVVNVDNNRNIGEASTKSVPGPVRNLSIISGENSLDISWALPENSSCIVEYLIILENTAGNSNYTTSDLHYNISSLEACTLYTVTVAAISDTGTVGESKQLSTSTLTPEQIEKVTNLKLDQVSDYINATWGPPTGQGACINQYQLVLRNQNNISTDFNTTDTYYKFSSLVGCMRYNIQVTAMINENSHGISDSQSTVVGDLPVNPPEEKNVISGKTWIQITLGFDSYSENMCNITGVNVTCEARKENNEDLPWLVTLKEEFLPYSDSSSRPHAVINITDLSEFTNYTCQATAINSGGKSNFSEDIVGNTLSGVPSMPRNLQINVINATTFNVTWEVPYKVPGTLTGYHIDIKPENPLHYIPTECEINMEYVNENLSSGTTHYLFLRGLPNFNYSVSVSASTQAGFGEAAVELDNTPTSVSESPRNLKYSIKTSSEVLNELTATLTWLLPCNTNGEINKFHMLIQGVSSWNEDFNHSITEIIRVNEPIENTSYSFDVLNIKPSYNYNVELYAVSSNENGDQEESAYISFTTPEGLPSAPIVTNISVTEDYVTIMWDPPVEANGELVMFKILITVDGPLHFIPNDCEIYQENFEFNVTAYETSFIFNDSLPYFNYSVAIKAATCIGFGLASDVWNFQTLPSASEPPRMLDKSLENVLGDVYDVTATLTWVYPCNTNGEVTHFIIDILGESLGNSDNDIRRIDIEIIPPEENFTYSFDILPLQNYSIKVYAVNINETSEGYYDYVTFTSPDGWPSAPIITDINVNSDIVTITWDEPVNTNGILQNYTIVINSLGPIHNVPEECDIDIENRTFVTEADKQILNFTEILPHYDYTVIVTAATRAGYGATSNASSFQTFNSVPEMIRNLTLDEIFLAESELFNASASLSFFKPCNLNGNFEAYQIEILATRTDFNNITDVINITDIEETSLIVDLKPEFNYTISIKVVTESFSSPPYISESFMSPAGIPPVAINQVELPIPTGINTAIFSFSENIFDNSSGNILYYSVILSGINEIGNISEFGFWNGTEDTWPIVGFWTENGDVIMPYQATPIRWNPFVNRVADVYYTLVIGEENCTKPETFCNGPLRAGTTYAVTVRGFTNRGFRNTAYSTFSTLSEIESDLALALILGLTFGILAIILLLIFIFILWRKKRKQSADENDYDPLMPASVSIKEFPRHYDDFKTNLNKLKSEYTLLERKSAELSLSTDIAETQENRRKNRYVNILPYNDSRVKLDTDKNGNYSDYINASYVKGYSGNVEYIATQGPLESTMVDFWRMVMQDKVSVIVMVAQFVENGKQKCYKYFPNNHENMEIGDGIEIRCSNELDFGNYIVRSLLVQRELSQWNITHLQYTDWPDFGCPTGTQSMLQFCTVMRSYMEKCKSRTIVHCSAGVGRTGTLIAVDILLQAIENNHNINVFKTVLDMRKQRSHMVQTEKQYMYIHTCIKDYILKPLKTEDKISEPIYENVDIMQNIINGKVVAESAL